MKLDTIYPHLMPTSSLNQVNLDVSNIASALLRKYPIENWTILLSVA